jgi:hypothetical protein
MFVAACGPAVEVTMDEDMDEDEETSGSESPGTTSDAPAPTAVSSSGPSLDVGTVDPGTDGAFLFALAPSINPATPFQFVASVTVADGLMRLILNPLTLDIGSTTTPRLPTNDYLAFEAVPVVDDCFTLDMGEAMLRGDTNPITGSDVVATIRVDGCFTDAETFCGDASGAITVPADISLAGSTFAAIAVEPTALPDMFPTGC